MFYPQADNYAAALKDWGIEVQTDHIAVHEAVREGAPRQAAGNP